MSRRAARICSPVAQQHLQRCNAARSERDPPVSFPRTRRWGASDELHEARSGRNALIVRRPYSLALLVTVFALACISNGQVRQDYGEVPS